MISGPRGSDNIILMLSNKYLWDIPNNTQQVNNKVDMWIVFKSFRKELTFALYYTTFKLFSHCAHKTDWIQCNLLNG